MAIFRKGKKISGQLHEGKKIKQIYHIGKKYLAEWLSSAAIAVIKAAFGAEEGKAVIRKTDDYLNQIAITDPQRAQQLTMFINEDPMLVCSLVETSKTRWLVGDGVAWIDTGYVPVGDNLEFYTKFRLLESGQYAKGIFGKGDYLHQIPNAIYITTWFQSAYPNIVMTGWDGKHGGWVGDTTGTNYEYIWEVFISFSKTKGILNVLRDGVNYENKDVTGEYNKPVNFQDDGIPLYLFKGNNFGACKCAISEHYTKDKIHHIPHLRPNGECGMLDIISCTFYPNANTSGAFTIQLTDKI